MNEKYKNIINMPHHVSGVRRRMSAYERAAQFAPFAALSGFEGAVAEEGRLTAVRIEPGAYEADRINEAIRAVSESEEGAYVSVTYFVADKSKSGGEYRTLTERVLKIDEYERALVLPDGKKIPIDDIFDMKCVESI